MSRRAPKVEAGERIVVTTFECRSVLKVGILILLHYWLKPLIRRDTIGLIIPTIAIDWRHRRVFSISIWKDLVSIYSMGMCPAHVSAARLPRQLGIITNCVVYAASGDWRAILFRGQEGRNEAIGFDIAHAGPSGSRAGRSTSEEPPRAAWESKSLEPSES